MEQSKAEYMRNYRRTHPNYDRHHNDRQKRYTDRVKLGLAGFGLAPKTKTLQNRRLSINSEALKKGVLTHYGGGKCVCVKCGQSDIDCLSLDHINNDGHHRTSKHRVGGHILYRKLMNQGYPAGYQTLCMSCNFAKSLKHLRDNGRSKNIIKDEILPLFKYFEDVALKAKDVISEHSNMDDRDVINLDDRGTTGDDSPKTSIVFNLSADDVMTSFEVTRY
jgi:hypothetical protein